MSIRAILTALTSVASGLFVLLAPAFGEPPPRPVAAPVITAISPTPTTATTTTTTTTTPLPQSPDTCATGWCERTVLTQETGAVVIREGEWRTVFILMAGEKICARPAVLPIGAPPLPAGDELPAWAGSTVTATVHFQADLEDGPGAPCSPPAR